MKIDIKKLGFYKNICIKYVVLMRKGLLEVEETLEMCMMICFVNGNSINNVKKRMFGLVAGRY